MPLSVPSGDLPLAGTLCRVPHPYVQHRCRKRSRSSIDRLWKALTGTGRESLGNARFWDACCDMETGHGHRSALIAAGPLRRVLALARFLVWCRADFHRPGVDQKTCRSETNRLVRSLTNRTAQPLKPGPDTKTLRKCGSGMSPPPGTAVAQQGTSPLRPT